jgi:amicyanin
MNKKILIILIIAIVIIAGVIYFVQQPKSVQNNQSNQPSSNETSQPANNNANTNPEVLDITIQNFSFNPGELNIKKGDTVTWTNQDAMFHRISGTGFQSDPFNKGQSFSFTFNTAGTFDYICSIHPFMKGKIIVSN